jgi:hypothetical protein
MVDAIATFAVLILSRRLSMWFTCRQCRKCLGRLAPGVEQRMCASSLALRRKVGGVSGNINAGVVKPF